jgi:hypothetical protein
MISELKTFSYRKEKDDLDHVHIGITSSSQNVELEETVEDRQPLLRVIT